jgi:hypothetical protein
MLFLSEVVQKLKFPNNPNIEIFNCSALYSAYLPFHLFPLTNPFRYYLLGLFGYFPFNLFPYYKSIPIDKRPKGAYIFPIAGMTNAN